jgi:hypothetical protein
MVLEYALLVLVCILIILPPKYDLAILWKEKWERARMERERKHHD